MKPRVDHIRVFGSLAWVHLAKNKRRKLRAKSIEEIVNGRMNTQQYKVWLREPKTAEMSRHLRIAENSFPGKIWFRTHEGSKDSEDEDESQADTYVEADENDSSQPFEY